VDVDKKDRVRLVVPKSLRKKLMTRCIVVVCLVTLRLMDCIENSDGGTGEKVCIQMCTSSVKLV